MGNSNKNESSYESNIDKLNFILSEDYSCIMKDATTYDEEFQETPDNNSCLHLHDTLEFTKLYNFRCQGKIKEPEVLKSSATIMYAEDTEPNYEKDMDINYSYPDSQLQFVLEL
jgi:hypothetical protein